MGAERWVPPTRDASRGPETSAVFCRACGVMWPGSVPSPVHPKSGLATWEQSGSEYGAFIPPRNPPSPPFLLCCVGRGGRAALGHGCSSPKTPQAPCGAPLGATIAEAGAQTLQHVPAELCPGDKVQRVCWHLAVTPQPCVPRCPRGRAVHPWVTPGASIRHSAGAGLEGPGGELCHCSATRRAIRCRQEPGCCAPPTSATPCLQ